MKHSKKIDNLVSCNIELSTLNSMNNCSTEKRKYSIISSNEFYDANINDYDPSLQDDYISISNYEDFEDISLFRNDNYDRDLVLYTSTTTDYSNHNFCHYCRKGQIIPEFEIFNFIQHHIKLKKQSKYLIILFRLCPYAFTSFDVVSNKHLKKYMMDFLNLKNTSVITDSMLFDIYSRKATQILSENVYENLFHQHNLNFTDYIKCDICESYICPMHIYLSNCYFAPCNLCNSKKKNNKWSVCGWCKSNLNEFYYCDLLH